MPEKGISLVTLYSAGSYKILVSGVGSNSSFFIIFIKTSLNKNIQIPDRGN